MVKYSTNIPAARANLLRLANMLENDKVSKKLAATLIRNNVEELMTQKETRPYRHNISQRMTPALKEEIISRIVERPDLTNREIGEEFNVADGRISEIRREAGL